VFFDLLFFFTVLIPPFGSDIYWDKGPQITALCPEFTAGLALLDQAL
jgi:hypothetical protein